MASIQETDSAWEQILHNHPALSRPGKKNESGHTAQLAQANTASLHAGNASLRANSTQPFKRVLADAVAGVQDTANTFVDGLESFGKTSHDSDDWEEEIDGANYKAEQNFKENIHRAFEGGKQAIRQLPASERQSAAEAFRQSMDIIDTLIGRVQGELSSVTRHVLDFERRIWSSLEQLRREVSQWCSQTSQALDV